mmetsp:Transcript_7184/g.25657  ORF Transcript_7184/g.25657 Transcript_7184/m.25657 type:complete len:252 (+) Transcript_7184:1830-2585(+)
MSGAASVTARPRLACLAPSRAERSATRRSKSSSRAWPRSAREPWRVGPPETGASRCVATNTAGAGGVARRARSAATSRPRRSATSAVIVRTSTSVRCASYGAAGTGSALPGADDRAACVVECTPSKNILTSEPTRCNAAPDRAVSAPAATRVAAAAASRRAAVRLRARASRDRASASISSSSAPISPAGGAAGCTGCVVLAPRPGMPPTLGRDRSSVSLNRNIATNSSTGGSSASSTTSARCGRLPAPAAP